MIKVTIDIVPHGIEEAKKTVGAIHIVNDRTGTNESGNYQCTFYDESGNPVGKSRVESFSRTEEEVFALLYYALRNMWLNKTGANHED